MSESVDPLRDRIHSLRGHRVILDADLARLYGASTKRFNEAFKRNASRFPADFAFQLTAREFARMRAEATRPRSEPVTDKGEAAMWSQNAATSTPQRRRWGNLPWAFTEHGAVMAANILRSEKAIEMSVYVVRAFIKQREALAANATILRKLAEIDRTLIEHDTALQILWKKLQPLLAPPPEPPRRRIGFNP